SDPGCRVVAPADRPCARTAAADGDSSGPLNKWAGIQLIMGNRRLIQRYILRGIFPYILLSLVLLTAILFAQQTVRYLEGTFQGLMPIAFVNGIALSLLPAVLIFTLPMAVLAGTIIGLGRMGSQRQVVS